MIYTLPLIIITILNYFIALKVSKENESGNKRFWVILSVIISVSILIYFKIASSFGLKPIFRNDFLGSSISVLIPIGISFYTFQTLAYLIDVYKGRTEAEKNLAHFALFVSFFPQVLAGPIERAKNLLHQLKSPIHVSANNIHEGFKIFLWGYFKKVLVADKLGLLVNPVFNQPSAFSSIEVILGVIFFSFQIYCDFSGYCDMGLGIAKALGIDLSVNFFRPYTATSLRDFWQRWHMTFTKWLRTFIFIPLGGNKVSSLKWLRNLTIVFVLSGLWHGIRLTFLVWGGLHFLFFTVERLIYNGNNIENKIPRFVRQILVFAFVSFAWIFFRSSNLGEALSLIKQIFSFQELGNSFHFSNGFLKYGDSLKINTIQIISLVLPFLTYFAFEFFGYTYKYFNDSKQGGINKVEILFINIVVLFSLFFVTESSQQFIYFKF